MKKYAIGFLASFSLVLHLVAQPLMLLQPVDDPEQPDVKNQLIWSTEPGIRYALQRSTDLSDPDAWENVEGYPTEADALAQQKFLGTQSASTEYYRVLEVDEQPPKVKNQFPVVDGFAVGRFEKISVDLEDSSGITPSSISLSISGLGVFGIESPELTLENNTITFDTGGDVPMGAYGEIISVTLLVSDPKGNSLNYTWDYRLELSPEVNENIFVFGSPAAQRAGQQVRGPASELATRIESGPIRMNGSVNPWSIESVETDRILITYQPGETPLFTVGELICNLVPTAENEIFYRRILSVTDIPASSELILLTEDVPLTEFVTQGTSSLSENSVAYELDANGTFIKAVSLNGSKQFSPLGFDLSGSQLKLRPDGYEATVAGVTSSYGDQPPWIEITAIDWSWWLLSEISTSMEIKEGELAAFDVLVEGTINSRNSFDIDVLAVGSSTETTIFDLPSNLEPKKVVYIGQVGFVPVFGVLAFDFKIKSRAKALAVIDSSFSYDQDISLSFGILYDENSGFDFPKNFQYSPSNIDSDISLSGVFSIELSLEPEPQFLVFGLAGFLANIEPYAGISVKASQNTGFEGELYGGVDFTLAPAGPAFKLFPIGTKLSVPIVRNEWSLNPTTLEIATHPQSQTIFLGDSVTLNVSANMNTSLEYQWYDDGIPIPKQTTKTLFLPRANLSHAGNYFVRVMSDTQLVDSEIANLTVVTATDENKDSDGDGLLDSVESNTGTWVSATDRGTDPYKWDSDGDGLSDRVETRTFIYVSKTDTGTDPNLYDTDADSFDDGIELLDNTHPLIGLAPKRVVPVLSLNTTFVYLIRADGTLWKKGGYTDGGWRPEFYDLNLIEEMATNVTKVVSTQYSGHVHFLKSDGSLWAQGYNSSGQLGDGTTTTRESPVNIANEVADISVGGWASTFILKKDGSLWATGNNYDGQLGDGTTIDRHSPVQIASDVSQVSAQDGFTYFLKNDGSLWAMGDNSAGQLGDGTTIDRHSPVQVASDVSVLTSAGRYFIKNDGELWAMGDNRYGQLGDGTTTNRNTPIFVATDVYQVSATSTRCLFITNDGILWAMGRNENGELGDGTTIDRHSPVKIAAGVSFVDIGYGRSLFIKGDGTLWGMGINDFGQLGEESQTNHISPIMLESGVINVNSDSGYTVYVKDDGSFWEMGGKGIVSGGVNVENPPQQIQFGE